MLINRSWLRARALVLAGLIGLVLAAGGALPADAAPPFPDRLEVRVQAGAGLAPDGQSINVSVLARCPEKWTVQQAQVTVTQPQASGSASFPLTCTGNFGLAFRVTVPAVSGEFELGPAEVTAMVTIKRGRTAQVQDTRVVDVDPIIVVDFGDRIARLHDGGQAADVDVTVACPRQTTGLASRIFIFQGQVSGVGGFVPVCDGQPHQFTVTVETSDGLFQAGNALVGPSVEIEFQGERFLFFSNEPIQLVN
jgi:hypothetical protein